jgi:hypothetical protein
MIRKGNGDSPAVWAYAYKIAPPHAARKMRSIAQLLAHEKEIARRDGRVWTGKLVMEEQVTHILVVCDRPEQDLAANLRLEAGLKGLKASFSITLPMAAEEDAAQQEPPSIPDIQNN